LYTDYGAFMELQVPTLFSKYGTEMLTVTEYDKKPSPSEIVKEYEDYFSGIEG